MANKFEVTMRLGTIIGASLAIIVAGGLLYYVAHAQAKPKLVTISMTACGVPATAATFRVPVDTLQKTAPNVPIRMGPLELPGAGGHFHLTFDPSADGRGDEVTMVGDTVHLPITFGRQAWVPKEVILSCRDGSLDVVRYQRSGSKTKRFTVAQAEPAFSSPLPAAEPELRPSDEAEPRPSPLNE